MKRYTALRDIAPDEELTTDYATFCDARMTPFDCQCGSPQCRGRIVGIDPMQGHQL